MMTREPKIGDVIEYNNEIIANPSSTNWKYAGIVVAVEGNICYLCNENLSADAHDKYFGKSPVPAGCEKANNGFIWRLEGLNRLTFGVEGLNRLHRIREM